MADRSTNQEQDTTARGSRMRRIARWAALLRLCPALVGYGLSWAMTERTKPQIRIVLGDGVHGPQGMAWVPGGGS
ncbi:hypothetical protein [Caballeronia sp. J97]|uniref:hypothetical protein n=1 Tax=Caballeronia sp. J97 TaxID=2805429 RepID=UPI0039EEC4E7